MKDSIDFIKIGEMAVININNMIPVPDDVIIRYEIQNEKDIKYRDLLRNEYKICKQKESLIINNANKLYRKVTIYNSYISKRCCNFKLLEQKCLEYQTHLQTTKEIATTIDDIEDEKDMDIEKERRI